MARNDPFSTRYSLNVDGVEIVDLTQDEDDARTAKRAKVKIEDLTAGEQHLFLEDEIEEVPLFAPINIIDDDEEDDTAADDFLCELNSIEIAADRLDCGKPASTPATGGRISVTNRSGITLKADMCVELRNRHFIYIKSVGWDGSGPFIKGIRIRRTRCAENMLAKKYNEVYAILQTSLGSNDPHIRDCPVTRSADDVVAIRELIFTNQPFPLLSFREGSTYYPTWYDVEEHAILVCRWKHTQFYDNQNKVREESLAALHENECTPGKGVSQGYLRRVWREHQDVHNNTNTKREGYGHRRDAKRTRAALDITDGTDDELEEVSTATTITTRTKFTSPRTITADDRFTYFDLCTGAGGMARGAQQAGLALKFFLDHWDLACKTLQRNWPEVDILHMDIYTFLTKHAGVARADILHISFPCQAHSMANTRGGKKDGENIAAGYSATPLLEKCRPRIVTFEQAPGIIYKEDGAHFRALIHQLTVVGFSARWKIARCDSYGNVQARKRLLIIGACPGETLPPFPAPTHGEGPGLKPLTTVRDRLFTLAGHTPEHHMQQHTVKPGIPYNANTPLRQCITKNGGLGDLHPNGRRSFTMQELASLAGFPTTHRFVNTGKTNLRELIGNAVPSCVGKALFRQIIKTMKETDAAIAAWEPEVIELG